MAASDESHPQRGGRGGRGGQSQRGGRGGSRGGNNYNDSRPMTTAALQAPEFKPQSSQDFFEERKNENNRFTGAGSNQPNNIT